MIIREDLSDTRGWDYWENRADISGRMDLRVNIANRIRREEECPDKQPKPDIKFTLGGSMKGKGSRG